MTRNERTSKRVATIAGRILRASARLSLTSSHMVGIPYGRPGPDRGYQVRELCTLAELRALAASALTQTRNK